jgi:hypothetical protein
MKNPLVARLLFISVLIIFAASFAAAAVAVPTQLAPAAAASVTSPVSISWSAVTDPSGILGYNWQVSTSSSFPTIAMQNSTNVGITTDVVSGLPNGTYYWRVQAVSGAFVQGAWSAARSFTITGTGAGSLAAPTLAPTKGYSTFHPFETTTFNWSAVPGAASYILQASTDPSFPIITRIEFGNIPSPSMTFVSANEGFYYARVFAVSATGVLSIPSNVINYTVFFNNPIGAAPAIVSPTAAGTLSLPITLTWADVVNPQPSGYEVQIARDANFATIEEDDPQLNGPSRTVLSLTPGQKFWRVRSAQGDASATTAALTQWSAGGSFTVNTAPAAPVALSLTNNPFYSGDTTWVAVQLSAAAPANGAIINLTSSNPAAAPVPATVNMQGNIGWLQFQMKAGQVTSPTPVTITATLNSGSASVQFTVMPPSLKSIIVAPNSISGGTQPQIIAVLNGQAPSGGASVNFTSSSSAVLMPAAQTILAGDTTVSFAVPTTNVSANTTAMITATWNGVSVQAPLTVTPAVAPPPPPPPPPPAQTATLTLSASGRNGERVTSSPAGISVAVGSSGSAALATGQAVTLSVSNGRQAIWSGACSSNGAKKASCTFILTGNASVSANVQ